MKNNLLFHFFFVLLAAACTPDLETVVLQGSIDVKVSLNNKPVQGAKVFTNPFSVEGITDSFGSVKLTNVDANSYEVYATVVDVGAGKSTVLVRGNDYPSVSINIITGLHVSITPSITISSPLATDGFSVGEPIEFRALVADDKWSWDNITVVWESSLDGELFRGKPNELGITSFATDKLTKGIHNITLTATNEDKFCSVGTVVVNTEAPQKLTLKPLVKKNGGVELSWDKYSGSDFFQLEIFRSYDDCSDDNQKIIATIMGDNVTSYFDEFPPMETDVCYFIRITNTSNYKRITNHESIDLPSGPVFDFEISDMFKHPTKSFVYLVDKTGGRLLKYDYSTFEVVNQVTLPGTIGYCAIADNGFGVEIYAPSSDGWIYIYQAEDLSQASAINVGLPTQSVVTNNKGLVIAALTPLVGSNMPVRVYSRETGNLLTGEGEFVADRVVIIPGTNEVLSMRNNSRKMEYFKFDDAGELLDYKRNQYTGEFPIDSKIVEAAPNGAYFITGKEGAVYHTGGLMEYKGQLQHGINEFSDFAFSADGMTIFAGTSNRKSIQIGDYPALTSTEILNTRGLPLLLVRDGNKIISLSKSTILSVHSGIEVVEF